MKFKPRTSSLCTAWSKYSNNVVCSAFALTLVFSGGCGGIDTNIGEDAHLKGKAETIAPMMVQSGEYLLEVTRQNEGDALSVRVGELSFKLQWDGETVRCPCRRYVNSVLDIYVELGRDPKVLNQRLGLSAKVVDANDFPGQFDLKLSNGEFPTIADFLALMRTMNDEEVELINKIAETDYEQYLLASEPDENRRFSQQMQVFWDNAEELGEIGEMLTSRVLQPSKAMPEEVESDTEEAADEESSSL